METMPTFVPVVAAALIDASGRVLMQRRRLESGHGGLWEFPGGKIERGESPESALLREIEEELAITLDPDTLEPLAFSSDPALPPAPRAPHVILLYTCRRWRGEPQARAGEAIAWFEPAAISALDMPPLDYPLARQLLRSFAAGG